MAAKSIITIDLGGTNLKIALLDLRYRIKEKKVFATSVFSGKDSLISALVAAILMILRRNRLAKSDILGVGVGLPGPIDIKRGIVHFFPNIPGWKKVNLKKILERRLKLKVFLDNDANLMALAEHRLGAAKGAKNAVCLTLGTGVGGGIISQGSLYRGSSFAAGEIGHVPLNLKGPACNCGGSGCLEAYIGNQRILKDAREIFKRRVSLEELSRLARQGNRPAIEIWEKIGRYLGVALSGTVNLLNPDCIVIGGGIANAGRVLFDQVKTVVAKRAMSVQARQVKIFKAKLGSNAGLIGAGILVKESLSR